MARPTGVGGAKIRGCVAMARNSWMHGQLRLGNDLLQPGDHFKQSTDRNRADPFPHGKRVLPCVDLPTPNERANSAAFHT